MSKKPNMLAHKTGREVKYYGFHTATALWKNRPDAIIRVYLTQERLKKFSDLLKWCAAKKKAYHIVDDEALAKIAAGVHHEGICILADEKPRLKFSDWLENHGKKLKECALIYLDGVQNPHNIGSILRISAHYGVPYIMGEKGKLPWLSSSAYRVAEGGGEFVEVIEADNDLKALKELKENGFQVVATTHQGKTDLFDHKFKPKTVFLLGAEVEGLSKKLLKEFSKETLSIPGTGQVESLNVALASGVVLSEYWRQIRNR